MYIRDLNFEFEKLESKDNVDTAQATTATSHTNWRDLKLVVQKRNLSDLLRVQKEKLETQKILKAREAFKKYHAQGEPRKSVYRTDLMEIS